MLDCGFVVGFCRAAALPGDYGGNCVQMRLSYSPFAPFILFLVEWMDYSCTDALPSYLGLLHILVYKVGWYLFCLVVTFFFSYFLNKLLGWVGSLCLFLFFSVLKTRRKLMILYPGLCWRNANIVLQRKEGHFKRILWSVLLKGFFWTICCPTFFSLLHMWMHSIEMFLQPLYTLHLGSLKVSLLNWEVIGREAEARKFWAEKE